MNKLLKLLLIVGVTLVGLFAQQGENMSVYKSQLVQDNRGNRFYIVTADRPHELDQAAKLYQVYKQGDHRAPYLKVPEFVMRLKNATEQPAMMAGVETGANRSEALARANRQGEGGGEGWKGPGGRTGVDPSLFPNTSSGNFTGLPSLIGKDIVRNSTDNSASRQSGGAVIIKTNKATPV